MMSQMNEDPDGKKSLAALKAKDKTFQFHQRIKEHRGKLNNELKKKAKPKLDERDPNH